jgi:hypothetical protein
MNVSVIQSKNHDPGAASGQAKFSKARGRLKELETSRPPSGDSGESSSPVKLLPKLLIPMLKGYVCGHTQPTCIPLTYNIFQLYTR